MNQTLEAICKNCEHYTGEDLISGICNVVTVQPREVLCNDTCPEWSEANLEEPMDLDQPEMLELGADQTFWEDDDDDWEDDWEDDEDDEEWFDNRESPKETMLLASE